MSNFEIFRKLWTSVYPPNKAIQHLRLCTRPIQTLTNVWFFEKTKLVIAKFSDRKVSFLQFLLGFGGAGANWTSKSASSWFFAPGTPILRSETPRNTSDTHSNTSETRPKHVTFCRLHFFHIFGMPLFAEFRQTSQETFDSNYDPNVSWDVCQNSSKSGITKKHATYAG